MTNKLLSIEDLSDYLGIPENTLYQWRTKGYGPAGFRVGKYVRYRPEDVDSWIEAQGAA
jgi:excisionase family DNA binding protein